LFVIEKIIIINHKSNVKLNEKVILWEFEYIIGKIFIKLIHKIWLKIDLNKFIFDFILFFIIIILLDKISFFIIQ